MGSNTMVRLISQRKAAKILEKYNGHIRAVAARYGVPEAVIKAILFQEMTMIDAMDLVADLAVLMGPRFKRDSSTGYAQIFGYVGLNAANFAVDRGMATYESLGIASDHRLDPSNQRDVRKVWLKLFRNRKANIEIAALNMLVAADQMTGRIDFASFSADELKLVLTRYNANVKHVTPYGEQAFRRYKAFCES